jgi:hypothetical protein
VEGTATMVGIHRLCTELSILGLVADKRSRDDHHLFATDEDDLLSSKELLCHQHGSETSMHEISQQSIRMGFL